MWRPNPRHSKGMIWRKIVTDWESTDENGKPAQSEENIPVYAEVYAGVDPVTRQAFGIQQEEAVTVQMSGKLPSMEDFLVIDGKIFRPASILNSDPVQITAVYTGRKDKNANG